MLPAADREEGRILRRRTGPGQSTDGNGSWRPTLARRVVAEAVGSALLLATVVGSGIMAEFANPAVTLARAASDTFAGIRAADAPGFIAAQALGAASATLLFRWLVPSFPALADRVATADHEENAA